MRNKIIVLIMVVVAVNVTFASLVYFAKTPAFVDPGAVIGGRYPDFFSPKTDISKEDATKRTVIEMLNIAVENFYAAPYVARRDSGTVNGNVMKNDFIQHIQVKSVRQKGEVYYETLSLSDSNNPPMVAAFAPSKYEQKFVGADGKHFYRAANGGGVKVNADGTPGECRFGAWERFGDLASYKAAHFDNPGGFSIYLLNEETILTPSPVVHNKTDKTYEYSFQVDFVKGTADYVKVMTSMMSNMTISFSRIYLTYTQWENGMLKQIDINEEYKTAVAGIATTVSSTQRIYYSYDETEKGYQIAEIKAGLGI